MRVTQSMLTNQFLYNLNTIDNRMQTEQEQMTTGKVLNKPSDNPLAVQQDMSIETTLAQTTTYQGVISSGQSWMQNTSSAMDSMTANLRTVQQNVLEALNSANGNPSALAALAKTTQQTVNQIYSTLNTKQGNDYVFGGALTNTPPANYAQTSHMLAGASGTVFDNAGTAQSTGGISQNGDNSMISSFSDGSPAFLQSGQSYQLVLNGSSVNIVSGTSSISGTLELEQQNGTVLASATLSGLTLSSGSTVSLVGNAGGSLSTFTVSLNPNLISSNASGSASGTYQQTDTLTPSEGTDTSIKYAVAAGVTVPVNVTAQSLFHHVPKGATQDLQTTLSSIVSDLNQASAYLSNGASATGTSYGQVMNQLENTLLPNLQANMNQMINSNADVGTRLQRLTAIQNQMNQYQQTLTNQQSKLENADMAKVITQFTTDQTVYQAALQMGAKVLMPSLINFLS